MRSRPWEVLLPALTLLVAASASNFSLSSAAAARSVKVVPRGEVEFRDGLLRLSGQSEPFDGILIENWSASRRKAEVPVRDGRVDGVTRGWYESGVQEVEEGFRAGVSHGWRTRWHPNGRIKSRVWIQHGMLAGFFHEWHSNGRLAQITPLRSGQAWGEVIAWGESGDPLSRIAVQDRADNRQGPRQSDRVMRFGPSQSSGSR